MSNAVFDASLLTRRMRELTLYAWQRDAAGSVQKLQTSEKSQEPVAAVALGGQIAGQSGDCACSGAVNTIGFRRGSPARF